MIYLIESLNFRLSSTSYIMVFSHYVLEIYFVFTQHQTNSMAWNQSWEARSRLVSQEIRSTLLKQQVHHHVHKSRQ
jgi:hypothetical protein